MKECFVYGLYDPLTEGIFYVGKGTGYRDRSHLKPSMWKDPLNSCNPFLYYKIKSLIEANTAPIIRRIASHLSDSEAYELETSLITKYGKRFEDGTGKLFNISEYKGGNYSGCKLPWTEDRRLKHQELCKIRRTYDPSFDELYREYVVKNKTRQQIANENGCSSALIKIRLCQLGINKPKGKRYPSKNTVICKMCSTTFEVSQSVKRKYCSRVCYRKERYGT